jgi:hypothetical protein
MDFSFVPRPPRGRGERAAGSRCSGGKTESCNSLQGVSETAREKRRAGGNGTDRAEQMLSLAAVARSIGF